LGSGRNQSGDFDRVLFRQPALGNPFFHCGVPHPRMDWIHEELAGKKVYVPAHSFWQVNGHLVDPLAGFVAELAATVGCERLIDAYAGVGYFSLALGPSVKAAVLVETDRQALAAARRNHQHWHVRGREFQRGRSEKVLPRVLAEMGTSLDATLAILDPPRSGCGKEVLRALCEHPPKWVIYVSCNASTLARDLRSLTGEGGYAVERLALFDMFPQTAHFETVALLAR
jgi:23S rRNA (uracil1939-C5)-methyltransferase